MCASLWDTGLGHQTRDACFLEASRKQTEVQLSTCLPSQWKKGYQLSSENFVTVFHVAASCAWTACVMLWSTRDTATHTLGASWSPHKSACTSWPRSANMKRRRTFNMDVESHPAGHITDKKILAFLGTQEHNVLSSIVVFAHWFLNEGVFPIRDKKFCGQMVPVHCGVFVPRGGEMLRPAQTSAQERRA